MKKIKILYDGKPFQLEIKAFCWIIKRNKILLEIKTLK